ncbi:reverse transcriptase domain-containing protein [Tanacetum coccineum]
MADNRTMAQMLQAPIEGYEDAIVTSTFRHPEVPNTSVKLLLFPFSLDGEARDWLDKEPPRSILTWDDLVSKFINQYFPPSKTTYYRNEIITFYQKPNEAFNEAWERFKGLLRQCPHHGFSELHQLDTFYNSLNSNDQDALDSAAGGNFLDKMPQEGLAIIESKSKVRYSRSRANDSRVSTDAPLSNSSSSNNSFDMQQIAASLEDKMTIKMNQMMNQMKALVVTTPAPVKAVEEFNQMVKLVAKKQRRSLRQIAITTVNAEELRLSYDKGSEKLEDPGKISYPCALQELKRTIIESLPMSPILVEDSEPTQEEIDILLVPDNLIPPGVEDADSEDEVNESPNLDHQDDPSIPRPPPEPPDIKKCFEPKAGILIIKEFKGVSKSHDFMTSILPTLVSDLPFISSIVSFENEDTIFDPGIVTFLRAGGIF